MISIVYTLGPGSHWQDNELRFSLRSVERYVKNYRDIWVVGTHPKFAKNISFLMCTDQFTNPSKSIMNKLMMVCSNEAISDPFFYIHDDHFITHSIDPLEFPNYYRGELTAIRNETDYMQTVMNTINALQGLGMRTLDFDTHTPILFSKIKLMQVINMVDWNVAHGYCIKSLYGNATRVEPTFAPDGKFARHKSREQLELWFDRHAVVSIDDGALDHELKRFLAAYYPNKSKYE